MEPTIGRIALYRLAASDLTRFAGHLEAQGRRVTVHAEPSVNTDGAPGPLVPVMLEWEGNRLKPGEEFPMVVVRPWHQPGHYVAGESVLNGHVLLDGPATLWALSVAEGSVEGTWHWPPRS